MIIFEFIESCYNNKYIYILRYINPNQKYNSIL